MYVEYVQLNFIKALRLTSLPTGMDSIVHKTAKVSGSGEVEPKHELFLFLIHFFLTQK